MSSVFIVEGEHPYDPYRPLEVFASSATADERAAELTREFLEAVWEIEQDDTPLIPMPEVTVENWPDIIREYSSKGDADGFGRWHVELNEFEVKP
jgi:hypothetical protein